MPIRELNRPPKKATERTMKISDLAGPETNDLSAAAAELAEALDRIRPCEAA